MFEFIREDKYLVTAADGPQLKRLLQTFEPDEIRKRMCRYLEDNDEWLVKQGHTLKLFASRINAYANGTPAKTAGRGRKPPIVWDDNLDERAKAEAEAEAEVGVQ